MQTCDSEWIPGPMVLPEVVAITGKQPKVSYRKIIELASSARFPLENRNGRWGCTRPNLPRIAEALAAIAA